MVRVKPGKRMHRHRVAVVGAGWAGCAAAVELTLQGHQVELYESSRSLGGRARGLRRRAAAQSAGTDTIDTIEASAEAGDHLASARSSTDDQWEERLDNGQHILLGAYRETLRLMRTVGIDIDKNLLRLPLQMRYPIATNGMDFLTTRLPAPLHLAVALLRATGLTAADKMAVARFSSAARWIDWRLNLDCSVAELLERFNQTDRVILLLWRPLCIAALNTPPERASAQVFLNVLRDSLGARRAASDMLLPTVDLSALFPDQAARFIAGHGATLRLATRVTALRRAGDGWVLDTGAPMAAKGQTPPAFDRVILATPVADTVRLLASAGHVAPGLHFDYEPITTCYLQYAADMRLAQPFNALLDDPAIGHWGQFVFDRGQLDESQAGLLAVVISASGGAVALAHAALCLAVAAQLAQVFDRPALRQPLRTKVISEKRATFSCTPGLLRPGPVTGLAGVLLAGDYVVNKYTASDDVASDYPATIESAVRSGVRAAACVDKLPDVQESESAT